MAHIVYKPIGKTPTEVMNDFKKILAIQVINKICCSGRLDPMAHGQLLILVNDECKKIPEYNKKDKEYQFSFVLGISTDTTDVLGLINSCQNSEYPDITKEILSFNNISYQQDYHIFSSNTVIGPEGKKPLFYYARKNIPVAIPTKLITIYNLSVDGKIEIDLKKLVFNNLSQISVENRNNFRYSEITSLWDNYFTTDNKKYIQYTCTAKVSSGTYIRQLVKDISKKINIPCMVTDLCRTKLFI